jgi:2-dehydropantoate 2-reductase
MRVAVVGTGAVGGYFGGRLAQGGAELVVIARGAQLEAIRRDGIRIESVAGDAVVRPAECGDAPARVSPVEVVLLGVKAWQVASVAHGLAPLLAPGGCVLPLQNGIEAPGQIDQALGAGHALGGLCRILSEVIGPGRIRHSGIEPYVAFGELAGGESPRVRRLLEAFARAPGVRAELLPDIRLGMWRKFLLIAGWGAVAASSGAPIGIIRAEPELRRQLLEAMQEIVQVGRAEGVALGESDVRDALALLDGAPADGTTSLQRDLAAGRPAEVDAQIGAVVRLARAAGVPTPYHAAVLRGLEASSASWPGADWRGPAREQ